MTLVHAVRARNLSSAMGNKKLYTLCVIQQNDKILLGLKKRKIGAGYYNGFGGKVEAHETIEEAARREVKEEIRIDVDDLTKLGINTFHITVEPYDLEVHIFKSTRFKGEPLETDEMAPKWFRVGEIPYDNMWEDDRSWMPLFLEGKKFIGEYFFDPYNKIIRSELKEAEIL